MDLFGYEYILFILILINAMCQSTIIKFDDVDVNYVNEEFVDQDTFDVSVNYINSTYNTLRCKAIVLKKFPEDTRILAKLYGYAFGNYRVPMGITFDISTCDVKTKPIFVAPFVTAIGGDLDKCGPDVGEYGNDSFVPMNVNMLPKIFPANKYRVDVEVKNQELKIVQVQFFIDIV